MGYIPEEQGRDNIEKVGDLAGPAVRLYFYDPVHYIWQGSVLIACHTKLFGQQAPLLNYKTTDTDPTDVVGEIILTHSEWSVVRFRLRAVLEPVRSRLEYAIRFSGSPKTPTGTIELPSSTETWHTVAISCNDQRQIEKTGTAAWSKLRMLHEKNPVHALLATGDQLYLDNVWHAPQVEDWINIKDKEKMRSTPLTPEQQASVEEFYFFAYVRWLAFHPLRQHLSGIPTLATWDDHEIFDGWGSYPPNLQDCAAFQQVFRAAKKMYAAFQLHCTDCTRKSDGYFSAQGDGGLSWMTQLGPSLAVVGIDTRSSRTRARIIPEKLLETILQRIQNLPATVQHLIVVSAVPVHYTNVALLEKMLAAGEGNSLFKKTGVMNKLLNEFGEPELLDDLLDHWSSSRHSEEKGLLLNDLRALAASRSVRITILSGDVHVAAYNFTCSTPNYKQLAADPGYMPQIITSPIGYAPAAGAAIAALDQQSGHSTQTVFAREPKLYAGMGQLFREKQPSGSIRFANRNNFLELEVSESRLFQGVNMLKCTWHIREGAEASDEPDLDQYTLEIPPIVKTKDVGLLDKIQKELERTLPKRGTIMRKVPCCGGCFAMCGL